MTGNLVEVERVGARAEIVLNRPERKNSITHELTVQLVEAILQVSSDSSVNCVLLRGEGGAFCSGVDLKESGDGTRPGPLPMWPNIHAALYSSPAPIVVALEKYAINAGAALALSAHVLVAGESSFLQVGELAIGALPAVCAGWLHLRHSPAVADRLLYLADRVPAAELLRLGVVTEVVPDTDVVTRARELADRIASYPVSGRKFMNDKRKSLRGELDDPVAWFSQLFEP